MGDGKFKNCKTENFSLECEDQNQQVHRQICKFIVAINSVVSYMFRPSIVDFFSGVFLQAILNGTSK